MIPTPEQIADAAEIVAEAHSCSVADVVGRSKVRLHARARAVWCGWMHGRGLRPADIVRFVGGISRSGWPAYPLEWHAASAAIRRFSTLTRDEQRENIRHVEDRLCANATKH